MVIGAHQESDFDILKMAEHHYQQFKLRRVYYSGYIPINPTDNNLPAIGSAPPMIRENRLYQSDWLVRLYGFKTDEIVNPANPHLDLDIDPKLSWALRNPQLFPIDLNTCEEYLIARVPGIGLKSAKKIAKARKFGKIHVNQIKKMGIAFSRAQHFMVCVGHTHTQQDHDPLKLRQKIVTTQKSKYEPQLSPQLSLGF